MTRGEQTAAAAVVAALLLSGCTGTVADEPPPPAPQAPEVTIEPAWTLDGYTPVSSVQSIGDDGFALYALNADAELEAIAVDADTGEVRWHHPANPSWVIAGVGLSIAADDDLVVFLTGAGGGADERGLVHLAGVAADDGEVRWVQPSLTTVTSHPSFCDDGRRICAIGRQGDTRLWAVLDRSGQVQALTPVADGRTVSANLFPTDDSTALKRLDFDGTEQWRRPAAELFAGVDVSPNHGWHIHNLDGRYVGQLGIGWQEDGDSVSRMQLGERVLAAFDEESGDPLWSKVGAFVCGGIEFTLDHPVRCVSDGQWVVDDGEHSLVGEVTVEGYDPATGEAVWWWQAGHVPGLIFRHQSVRRFDDTTYLVNTGEGEMLLDVATGQARVTDEPRPAWCSERRDHSPALEIEGKPDNDLVVTEWWPCHADGTALDRPVSTPEFAGAGAGDVFAWVQDGELRAVTLRRGED